MLTIPSLRRISPILMLVYTDRRISPFEGGWGDVLLRYDVLFKRYDILFKGCNVYFKELVLECNVLFTRCNILFTKHNVLKVFTLTVTSSHPNARLY